MSRLEVVLALDSGGLPLTGLSPTWSVYKNALTGADITPQPPWTEDADHDGLYTVTVADDAVGIADFTVAAEPRYWEVQLRRIDVVTFAVYDALGAPKSGLSPVIDALEDAATGVPVPGGDVPAITAVGGGVYKFEPVLPLLRLIGRIDCTASAFPRWRLYDFQPDEAEVADAEVATPTPLPIGIGSGGIGLEVD